MLTILVFISLRAENFRLDGILLMPIDWNAALAKWILASSLSFQILAEPAMAQTKPEQAVTAPARTARTWRDSTGVFVVQAELIELSPTSAKLQLADGTTREVARELLSRDDQKFLTELEMARSPFAKRSDAKSERAAPLPADAGRVQPMAPKSFPSPQLREILPSGQNVILYSPTRKLEKLTTLAQEVPSVEVGEVYLADVESGSRVSPVLMLDVETKTVAVGVSPPIYSSRSQQPSQVFVGSLPHGPFHALVEMQDPFTLLDHNPHTGQTLASAGELGETGDRELILLEGLGKGELREVLRFRLPAGQERRRLISQAILVDKDQAIVVLDGVVYAWNLRSGTELYQTDPQQRIPGSIALSADRTLMTVPSSLGLHFVDSKTGKDLGFLECPNTYRMDVAFDPCANRIAYSGRDQWSVYDYETMASRRPETTTLPLGEKVIGWFSGNLIVTGGGIVLDTDRRIPIWKYGSSLWPTASIWKESVTMVDTSQGLRLRTLALPHKELRAALKELPDIKDLLLTEPGTKVALKLELPEPIPENVDRAKLEERLKQMIGHSGWEVDEQAKIQLIAKMAPGKPFTEYYQPYVQGLANPERTKVEITPMMSRLELRDGDRLVWHIESQNNRPSPYGSSPSKTKEDYIKQRQRALPEFFYSLVLPTRIPRPPYTFGFGESYIHDGIWRDPAQRNPNQSPF